MEIAIFGGGCFWCTEAEFAGTAGVLSVTSGYTGGHVRNPSYEQVSAKTTGHTEAIRIEFDPGIVSYDALLDIFWNGIDPTDAGGQFYDRGEPYRTAIFHLNEKQRLAAEASRQKRAKMLGQEIHTRILPASDFYPAEGYHQEYYRKNPVHYNAYKKGSGREKRLKEI